MTSLLTVMITFGSRATGKLGKETFRLAAIVSQLLSERQRGQMPGRVRCLAACHCEPDRCQRHTSAGGEGRGEGEERVDAVWFFF